MEYKTVEKFLANIKKEFGREDKEIVKIAELKRLKQGGKKIKKFMQEFRRVARDSGYEKRPLVEEFKRDMDEMIH